MSTGSRPARIYPSVGISRANSIAREGSSRSQCVAMIPLRLSGVFLCAAATLLVACGSGSTDGQESPATGTVDISLAGQTVTKVRASGNDVAFLGEQLNSIFEDG